MLVAGTYVGTNYWASHLYWILGGLSLAALLFSAWAGAQISSSVGSIAHQLTKNSKELSDAASKIAVGSTQLSEAATQQSASLQETTATVDQISSMIQKNAEAAQQSKDLSAQSKSSAEQGQQTVDSMMMAISDIETNNSELSEQVKKSNEQLSEITQMIHSISEKTKVINDIVFQTKLLSFNASVEAARAGEYGKGFAIVASEIGNLAQMSGGAAKEITEMLQESVNRVENIVQDTKIKIDKLMISSNEKVNYGSETAKQCKEALTEILTSVKSVDQLVTEIATASNEQSLGVIQITKAMTQLEAVTHQNSSVAVSSSVASTQMRDQTTALNVMVEDLTAYIVGGGTSQDNTSYKPVVAVKSNNSASSKKTQKPNKKDSAKKVDLSALKAKSVAAANQKPKFAIDPEHQNKVLDFNKKKQAAPANTQAKPNDFESKMKNASGLDVNVPSADHPGFKE